METMIHPSESGMTKEMGGEDDLSLWQRDDPSNVWKDQPPAPKRHPVRVGG